jgi:hypothetical protein
MMTNSNFTTVISLCTLDHADVWKLTSKLLPRFVEANRFIVYVPDNQVSEFRTITDDRIEVLSEELLGEQYADKLEQRVSLVGNSKRYQWYLQQFYKIEALLKADSQSVVIWDADCVPVQQLTLFSDNGEPIYMQASQELNYVYFETIEKMLNMQRVQDFSFIIPGFPISKEWVTEFAQYFQDKHGINWYDSIIENTPFERMSGFSEYETLGTWIANKYPNSWSKVDVKWERLGQSRYGYARKFNEKTVVEIGERQGLHVISFENWDYRGIRKILEFVKRNRAFKRFVSEATGSSRITRAES